MIRIPDIKPCSGLKDEWLLVTPWEFYHNELGIVVIEEGFVFDLASIPKFGRSLIQKTDRKFWGPSLEHDYLYRNGLGSREVADLNFLAGLIKNNVSIYKAVLSFILLRGFGKVNYTN